MTYGFTQWALLISLAKIGTVEMVGSFTLGLAIALPVLMFSSLSLRAIQVTDCERSYRFLEYVALRLLSVALSLIVIVGVGVASGYKASILAAVVLIGAAKSVEYVSDILYGVFQQQERMAGIGISMILRGALSVSALMIGVRFTGSLVWGATAWLLCSLLVLVSYDIPKTFAVANIRYSAAMKELGGYFKGFIADGKHRRLWKLGIAGLPMGGVLMLVSLNLNIPRYFIERHLGMRDLAIFSAIATLMTAGNLVTYAVGQAAAPRLAKWFAARDMRRFSGLLVTVGLASLALGALGWLGALLFGPRALALIYRPEYATHQDLLLWLMGASGFFYLGSTLGCAVTAVRCFNQQLPLFAVAAATTALGCMTLMPSLGLRGAAIAILASALIQCAGGLGLLYKTCRKALQPVVQAC